MYPRALQSEQKMEHSLITCILIFRILFQFVILCKLILRRDLYVGEAGKQEEALITCILMMVFLEELEHVAEMGEAEVGQLGEVQCLREVRELQEATNGWLGH
jgi:hypothetical protein